MTPARKRRRLPSSGERAATARALVGRDYRRARSTARVSERSAFAIALALGLLLGGFLLIALRTNIVRTRYAIVDAAQLENRLHARDRELSVAVRRLRDPRRLRRLAEARGFARPERVIELDPETSTTRELEPQSNAYRAPQTRGALQ